MNKSEIKSRIRDQIDDHSTAGVFFTDVQLGELIDHIQEIIVGDTHSVHRSVFVPIRPGGQFLFLPAIAPDIMQIKRVFNQSLNQRLDTTSIDNLSSFHQKWPTVTGNPEMWFTVSWDIIGFFPRPVEGGGVLRIDYDAWPRQLLDDSDSPETELASHDLIALFGQYFGELKKWNPISAQNAFLKIQKHGMFADARSNVAKIIHRTMNRTGPHNRSEYQE